MMKRLTIIVGWLVGSLLLFTPVLEVNGQSLDRATIGVTWTEDGSSLLVATMDTLYLFDADDWESAPQFCLWR